MKKCCRIERMPRYMFSDLDSIKNKMLKEGRDVIDISVGDPDLPTPGFIIDALKDASEDRRYHRYPPYEGTFEFKKAVADYYKRRFNVSLDAESEVIALIGSKEGITHLSLALLDEGDIAIVPDPGYPIYAISAHIAGATPHAVHLKRENNFLPDICEIDECTQKLAKLMFINYPNNPTGAVCSLDSMRNIIEFARKNDIIVCNDAAYNEIVFDNNKPVSLLNVIGAKEYGVELGTLSKSYNMTGWRIGYAVGNSDALKKMMAIKVNTDSGQFGAIQHAASEALNKGDGHILYMNEIYRKRRNKAAALLKGIGIDVYMPQGSIYLWFKVPCGYTSEKFASELIEKCGVIVTPGTAFGAFGEGFCRAALTVDDGDFEKAVSRMESVVKTTKTTI